MPGSAPCSVSCWPASCSGPGWPSCSRPTRPAPGDRRLPRSSRRPGSTSSAGRCPPSRSCSAALLLVGLFTRFAALGTALLMTALHHRHRERVDPRLLHRLRLLRRRRRHQRGRQDLALHQRDAARLPVHGHGGLAGRLAAHQVLPRPLDVAPRRGVRVRRVDDDTDDLPTTRPTTQSRSRSRPDEQRAPREQEARPRRRPPPRAPRPRPSSASATAASASSAASRSPSSSL